MLVRLRCYFILTLFVITLSSVTKDLLSFDGLDGVDHAPLASGHIDVAKNFISENFHEDGNYSLLKAKKFLERLEKELKSLREDLYETEVIERIELRINEPSKARKKALEDIEDDNKVIRGYVEYLIPKAKSLIAAIRLSKGENIYDDLSADIIRGYNSYYIPNVQRTMWKKDLDGPIVAKRIFRPLKFKRFSSDKVESNNLIISKDNIDSVSECLKKRKQVGDYLLEQELDELKACGFDISTLDPGVSAFWRKVTPEFREKVKTKDFSFLPKKKEKIKFKRVRLKGIGSPKFKATFERDGKKFNLKLKVGTEVNVDLALAKFGWLIGLNHDHMVYREKQKVYLGKTTYAEFASEMRSRWGSRFMISFVHSHGKTSSGKDWVVFKDILIEARPENELRVSPWDIGSWDLQNRREYRAMILWYVWLGMQDIKPSNFKAMFKETSKGLIPMYRLQDTGYGLGSALYLKNFNKIFTMGSKAKVNEFETRVGKLVHKDTDKEYAKFYWNDFYNRKRNYSQTTWADLKWMARHIASISDEEIRWVLKNAGFPEEVALIYRHKLALRRNEIVKIFSLENEFLLFDVPNLKNYSPSKNIKNGKIIKSAFAGKNSLVIETRGFKAFLAKNLNINIPFTSINKIIANSFNQKIKPQINLLAGLNAEVKTEKKVWEVGNQELNIGVGINFGFNRKVLENEQVVVSEGVGRPFKVIDSFYFEVGAHSKYFSKVMEYLPVTARAGIRVYRKEFENIHYAESVKDGFKSSFKLHYIMAHLEDYVADSLGTLEVVKTFDSFGLEVDASLSLFEKIPILSNGVALTGGLVRTSPVYFYRDNYGLLHIYKEITKKSYFGAGLNIASLNAVLASTSLVGLSFTKNSFFFEGVDYSFKLDAYNRDKASASRQLLYKKEREALRMFFNSKGSEDLLEVMHRNFRIHSEGKIKKSQKNFLYYFSKKRNENEATTTVNLSDGTERKFHRFQSERKSTRGLEELNLASHESLLVKKAKGTRITMEMDLEDKKNFVVLLGVQNFRRKLTSENLRSFIRSLNQRFSLRKSLAFYRDYHLPSSEKVPLYRKIYSLTRIFLDGGELINKIRESDTRSIEIHAQEYFKDKSKCQDISDKNLCQVIYQNYKTTRLLRSFKKVKRSLMRLPFDHKVSLRRLEKFLARLDVERFGVQFLRTFLGEKNLLVLGDISGIYRSFSSLQDLQVEQNRRFAAKSWGDFEFVSPIQHFLRYGHYILPNLHVAPSLSSELFGVLPAEIPINPD